MHFRPSSPAHVKRKRASRVIESLEQRLLLSATADSFPESYVQVGGLTYFNAYDGNNIGLWRTDGTAAGTFEIKGNVGLISTFTTDGTTVYFGNGTDHGIWSTDGTLAGTKNFAPNLTDQFYIVNAVDNGVVLFSQNGVIWRTDGTAEGTFQLENGALSLFRNSFFTVGSNFYWADGSTMWKSDGTVNGTSAIGTMDNQFREGLAVGSNLFILSGQSLYAIDNTTGTMSQLQTVPGQSVTNVGGKFYFDERYGSLWTSDGTITGTHSIAGTSGVYGNPVQLAGSLYFAKQEGPTANLWMLSSGGTASRVTNMPYGFQMMETPFIAKGVLYFVGAPLGGQPTLYRSTGDAAHTTAIKTIVLNSPVAGQISDYAGAESEPFFTSANGGLLFAAVDPQFGMEIWISDGTAAGTHALTDINQQTFASATIKGTVTGTTGDTYVPQPGWTIFIDSNFDGAYDAGDMATTTDSLGNYSFSVHPSSPDLTFNGDFVIREVTPLGWSVQSSGFFNGIVVVSQTFAGGTYTGNFKNTFAAGPGSISGTAFNDLNGNGVRDNGEPGLSAVRVFIDEDPANTGDEDNGTFTGSDPSVLTDANGNFHFGGLANGSYFLSEIPPAGATIVSPSGIGTSVTISNGSAVNGLNFANHLPVIATTASISGTVFLDKNANGKLDSGEAGIANVKVYLDANQNGVLDAGEPTATTDSSGKYKFSSLAAGSYRVREILPSGNVLVAPSAGYLSVTLAAGQNLVGENFADVVPGGISGTVYIDTNQNKSRESSEVGASGWKVYLDLNNNGKLDSGEASVTTGSNGSYSFTGRVPHSYVVRLASRSGWRATTATSRNVTVSSGLTSTGNNFGVINKALISGIVYLDSNHDGKRESTEAILSGWTIYVDSNKDGKLDAGDVSVKSTSSGWSFKTLAGGTYVVRAIAPTGYTLSAAKSFSITVAAGGTSSGWNFAATKTA